MKIMYVITCMGLGGAQAQLIRMIEYLTQKKGYNILLVTLTNSVDDMFIEKINTKNVKYVSLDMKRGKVKLKDFTNFIKLIKEFKPDIIHSHMIHANFLCRISKIFERKPKIINTIHGEEELLGARRIVYRLTDSLADTTTCIGEVIAKQAREAKTISEKRLKVIYNALDVNKYKYNSLKRKQLREELNLNEDDFVWIIVGRLDVVKDHKTLFDAMEILEKKKRVPNLLIVGDGEKREYLQNRILNNLELKSKIKFLGRRSDIEDILSVGDAFILSSLHEGLPLVLQEAASEGLPIVATDVGGCNEIIIDGKNGYLVPKKQPEKMASSMIKVMELSIDQRMKMGKYSIEFAKNNFDIENVMKMWMSIYEA